MKVEKEKASGHETGTDLNEMADWTIMVYMAGDNNLSEDMAFSLSEMGPAFPGTGSVSQPIDRPKNKVNLLAFFDSNSFTVPTHYIDFSSAKSDRHAVTPEDMVYPRGKSRGKRGYMHLDPENSGTASSILNFINWCIVTKNRKARNYAIIFSGHSFGFYGKSLLGDQSSGSYLTLRMLRWTLEEAVDKYLRQEKIAIVGFDSCEMGMLEVGYELGTAAHTVVASEGNLPASGWGYAPLLRGFIEDATNFLSEREYQEFTKSIGFNLAFENAQPVDKKMAETVGSASIDTSIVVKNYAKWFVQAFVEKQAEYAIGGRSVDMAAWDLDVIHALAENVGRLGDALLEGLAEPQLTKNQELSDNDAIVFNHVRSALLQSRVGCQTYMHDQAVDLKDFCLFLQTECCRSSAEMALFQQETSRIDTISKFCSGIIEEIDNTVLAGGFVGDVYQFSNGISLFFPWTAMTFNMTRSVYPELRFVYGERVKPEKGEKQEPGPGAGWIDFLAYYLFNVTLRRSRIRPEDFSKEIAKVEKYRLEGLMCVNTRENLHLDESMFRNADGSVDDAGRVREHPDSSSRENWLVRTRENWLLGIREDWRVKTKEDWRVKTKEDWIVKTKENWLVKTREDWRVRTREDWNLKTREQISDSIEYFDRVKNFQLNWEAFGYWDDTCSVGSKNDFIIDDVKPKE